MKKQFEFKKYTMSLTALVTFVLMFVLALYDFAAFTFVGEQTSVSNWLVNVAHASPPFVFMLGILAGHLFWPMKRVKE